MLVLLVLSSAVAALLPVDRVEDETTATTTTPAAAPPQGELVRATIQAEARKPKRISVHKGDQLDLTVAAQRPGSVEIVALGVLEDVDRFTPATIDLLLLERGTYPVLLLPPEHRGSAKRTIGRIVVGPPADANEAS